MKASVLYEIGKPLELRYLAFDAPKHGQVVVEIIASGICGAQLQELDGHKGTHFPRLMGHEGVVRVVECGPGVKTVKPGQKACAHWRKGAGLESESPVYSLDGRNITGGQVVTFASHAIVSENRLTPVPEDTPDEVVCLLGCSLSTALGTIEHEAKLLMGESVLIIGCGGLGLNLILAARLRGAAVIVATDVYGEKQRAANAMGAKFAAAFFGISDMRFDVVIDTSGDEMAIEAGLHCLSASGRFVMVGQPQGHVKIPNAKRLFDGTGCSIMATQGGRFEPSRDIPRYIAAWRSGHLRVEGIVTHEFRLDQINEAIELVRAGGAGRILLRP